MAEAGSMEQDRIIQLALEVKNSNSYYLLAFQSILPCKAKKEYMYLLTLQVSRYFLLAFQSSIDKDTLSHSLQVCEISFTIQ